MPSKNKKNSKRQFDKQNPTLIDTFVPFPIPMEGMENTVTEEYPNGGFRLKLDRAVVELYNLVKAELCLARRVPVHPKSVRIDDPLYAYIKLARKDEPNALSLVQEHYAHLLDEISTDAWRIALVAYSADTQDFAREPRPYGKPVEARTMGFAWLEQVVPMPPVEYNLANRFERRLKQISDVIEDATNAHEIKRDGFKSYRQLFDEAVEQSYDDTLSLISGDDQDEAGFPVPAVS